MSGAGAWVMARREFWSMGEGGTGWYKRDDADEDDADFEFRFGWLVMVEVVGVYCSLSSLLILLLLGS